MEVLPLLAGVFAAFLTSALLLLAALTTRICLIRRRYAHLPSPPGDWFFVGHIPTFLASEKKGEMTVDVLLRWCKEVGPVYVFWRIDQPTLIVSDPDAIKELSISRTPKPTYWQLRELFGERFTGKNLLTMSTYEEWKDRRRIFDPAFNISYLRSLVPMFNQVIEEELIHSLEICADGKTMVDMRDVFNKTALQVISWVAFGSNFSHDAEVQAITHDRDLNDLLITASEGAFLLFKGPGLRYFSSFYGGKYRDAARTIRAIGRQCIEQRIRALENKEQVPQDVLTLILSIIGREKNINIEDLVDEFVIFYAAGQETTSSLLSHTLVALLEHPEIMQSVVEEIDYVLQDKKIVSADELDKLTYLHQVLEESLRLWPPLPYIGKKLAKEATLCGHIIPKKTRIIISQYIMHRSSKHFYDPLKFDPGRFGPGQKRPSPYVYFPFGIGHRTCIGKVFAMLEAKVAMAHLLKQYTFELLGDFQLKQSIRVTLQPVGGIPCKVNLRNRSKETS